MFKKKNTNETHEAPTSSTGVFRFTWDDNVSIIEMNDEKKPINSFSKEILEDLRNGTEKILAQENLGGIVFISTKPGCFAAGIDIGIFDTLTTKEDGETACQQLHSLFALFQNSKVPTVSAIHGTCLGGGLELSLACQFRIATQHSSTQLGLPEIQLGLIPGGGGTQRLPRLIGITPALDLILTGKKVDAKKALKLGLVNAVVPENLLRSAAIKMCRENVSLKSSRAASNGPLGLLGRLRVLEIEKQLKEMDLQKLALETNLIGRSVIKKKSLEQIEKNTKGHYPAPYKAVEAIMKGISTSLEKGLALEAKLFGELVVTPESRSLVHIFRIMTNAKKNPYHKDAQKSSRENVISPLLSGSKAVGILGAGLMGSGIATVLADKNIRSIMLDRDSAGVQRGLKNVSQYFEERFKKRRIKKFERDCAISRVQPALNMNSMTAIPIVVEAVFEDLSIKHDILKKCEAQFKDENFVFATNTSSIPVTEIAKIAKRPENVVGMHFFSPVPKMPLVEIIVTEQSSSYAASTVFDLASKMGKNIVVVKDGPGFYTTRILAFMLVEALLILSEGADIGEIDFAMEKFGFPVGPITLIDEVGIDVAEHIIQVLYKAFADRIILPPEIATIQAEDRKGRKNSKGFYTYLDGKKDEPDESIYHHFKSRNSSRRFEAKEISDRCSMVFLNEAARCLDEGILNSADDGDLGAIFGLGFPPFLGGPFHWALSRGKADIKQHLQVLAEKHGKRFEPALYWSK